MAAKPVIAEIASTMERDRTPEFFAFMMNKSEHRDSARSRFNPTRRPAKILPRLTLRAGVVGLPDVGKSTLFNALTRI